MRAYLDDILFWVGAGLVTLGAWLVYVPAGFVCAGLFCLVFSVLLARSSAVSRRSVSSKQPNAKNTKKTKFQGDQEQNFGKGQGQEQGMDEEFGA
jgi:hypothetical protein